MLLVLGILSFLIHDSLAVNNEIEIALDGSHIIQKYDESARRTRHGSLQDFVQVLNDQVGQFRNWHHPDGSVSNYEALITGLVPWIIANLPNRLQIKSSPLSMLNVLDCGQQRYSAVLTGVTSKVARTLVDFIPFGYDIEKLEIRLYELYDVVDVFVIYESVMTQSGLSKPLIYNMVKNSTRFQKWSDKIIYLVGNNDELNSFWSDTMTGIN